MVLSYYKKIYEEIESNTWLKNAINEEEYHINLDNLKNIKYQLKDYQINFLKFYYNITNKNNLDGYILSFDQGLGKTLTSIALAECLNKDYVYIVCPNSLKENWSYEIKNYFYKYEDEEKWKSEVFVIGNNKYVYTEQTKYIIINQESIQKSFNYINKNNSIIIVDESHNFRDLTSQRSKLLLELKKQLKCKDVLMMSGTPIKANPNELIPSLLMVDPLFDNNAVKVYNSCFNIDSHAAKNIVRSRFDKIIYRRTKNEVLSLPEKYIENLFFPIKTSENFTIEYIRQKVNDEFKKEYELRLKDDKSMRKEFIDLVTLYSNSTKEDLDYYIDLINNHVNSEDNNPMHELTEEFFNSYVNLYVIPNIEDKDKLNRINYLCKKFINMRKSAMGSVIGKIIPPARSKMFIQLFKENKNEIINKIKNNSKKTIIFTTMLEVVNEIYIELEKENIGCIKITGQTSSNARMELIQQFKNDDNIDVLIATSQTLSIGVTLTEANLMFFFGQPWRSADYNQSCDRIHRIGQTTDVYIYNVLLKTSNKNLSTRMNDILEWSDGMFNNLIN